MSKYDHVFSEALDALHHERRYRVFANLERRAGEFPTAVLREDDGTARDVTIWCSNDYLGMGQHPAVLKAMHDAIDAVGSGSGGTRNIAGTTHYLSLIHI